MAKDQSISLQERIVNEISSTYKSIAAYKTYTRKRSARNKALDQTVAARRIEVVEHKLKALKMMLAKIDDGELSYCDTCHRPIVLQNKLFNRPKNRYCPHCS